MPLWPRPAVLPRPEPMPRPTRLRALTRSPGVNVFNLMSGLLDAEHVGDGVDHAAVARRVFHHHRMIQAPQPQAAHTRPMVLQAPVHAAGQRHGQLVAVVLCLVAHGQLTISSTDLPRRPAMSAGDSIRVRPSMVALTTLMGLLVPIHLARTLCTPTTSNTARMAPPAMMPVPSEAGCMYTLAAPCSPMVAYWSVFCLRATAFMFLRAASMAFWMAMGTSRALPRPMPTRPLPSPTTVSAVKPNWRPPLTTLATRLTLISFSRKSSLD